MHPLHRLLVAAADGQFPAVDGAVEVHPPARAGHVAVVEFTGHSVVVADVTSEAVVARGGDGFGGASHPDVLRWLAGATGEIGTHDAVLVARGTATGASGGEPLAERHDLADHPRVRRATRHRRDVRILGDEHGLITLGAGLVGRLELSVELLDTGAGDRGHGRRLIAAGLRCVDPATLVWAQVAPGNAASLRAFLSCGFVPIGAETLILTDDH